MSSHSQKYYPSSTDSDSSDSDSDSCSTCSSDSCSSCFTCCSSTSDSSMDIDEMDVESLSSAYDTQDENLSQELDSDWSEGDDEEADPTWEPPKKKLKLV